MIGRNRKKGIDFLWEYVTILLQKNYIITWQFELHFHATKPRLKTVFRLGSKSLQVSLSLRDLAPSNFAYG